MKRKLLFCTSIYRFVNVSLGGWGGMVVKSFCVFPLEVGGRGGDEEIVLCVSRGGWGEVMVS